MIFKNFEQLAISQLRRQALSIAAEGYAAIDTRRAIEKHFRFEPGSETLWVKGKKIELKKFKRVICVGFGKAAFEAVSGIYEKLGSRIACGYVIDLKDGQIGNLVCKIGTHPTPTLVNVKATQELVKMLSGLSGDDLVICVVSGGGSALLCYPHELSCEKESEIISALTVKGADIFELNTVRKHISKVKGGQLAKTLYPATCISLIFSDVPGNDLSMVASGPTVPDKTTMHDAATVLKKYDILELCQMPACQLLETPKDAKYFERVENILFVSAEDALAGMKEKAELLGFDVKIFSANFQGSAEKLASEILRTAAGKNICLLGAGESTVHIQGGGKGGRNMQMSLSGLEQVGENQVFLPLASDGRDNTEAAGAICDRLVMSKAQALGIEPKEFLSNNDSWSFFEKTEDLAYTGMTGANVSDFFVLLNS
jgi:glycerate-2-kinase